MAESKFKDIGLQLRAVRERLHMTLDDIKEQTGISRSYVSDFERGVRLPTSKYLRYLHDHQNINLNFVFCSEGRMLRMSEEEKDKLLIPALNFRYFGKVLNKELSDFMWEQFKVPSKNVVRAIMLADQKQIEFENKLVVRESCGAK